LLVSVRLSAELQGSRTANELLKSNNQLYDTPHHSAISRHIHN
jgi:hypothetical protein